MEEQTRETVKRIIGSQNVRRISFIKKTVSVHSARLLRTVSGGPANVKPPHQRTFALPKAHLFFGYYDVSQFSKDENYLLAMAVPVINTTPPAGLIARLGFFDIGDKVTQFHEFGRTAAWCWQQGCRLQWYPLASGTTVLYNDLVEKRYGSIIQDVITGKIIRIFSWPIYALSRCGKWGLSVNFSRLQRLRPGYGYNNLEDETAGDSAPSVDGIWRIDMLTGKEKILFSIRDIATMEMHYRFAGEQHYFNHLLFNKTGCRFMFFHITRLRDGRMKVRLLTSDIHGTDIRILNDSGHSSHYCWLDDDHLLCYSTVKGKGEGYFLFDVQSGESQQVGLGILDQDGHPSYLPGGNQLITDTYPDRYGESSLLMYDLDRNDLTILHKEYMPQKFNAETRCDFHPRVSPSGKQVCIDCIVNGRRVMSLFDIPAMGENPHAAL